MSAMLTGILVHTEGLPNGAAGVPSRPSSSRCGRPDRLPAKNGPPIPPEEAWRPLGSPAVSALARNQIELYANGGTTRVRRAAMEAQAELLKAELLKRKEGTSG